MEDFIEETKEVVRKNGGDPLTREYMSHSVPKHLHAAVDNMVYRTDVDEKWKHVTALILEGMDSPNEDIRDRLDEVEQEYVGDENQ